jgi:hypothetical protein
MDWFKKMAESLRIIFADLIRDVPSVKEKIARILHELELEAIEKITSPVYSGVGNHEICSIERDKPLFSFDNQTYRKNIFRYFRRPNCYSLNYEGIYFVNLATIYYQNPYYFGAANALQLNW